MPAKSSKTARQTLPESPLPNPLENESGAGDATGMFEPSQANREVMVRLTRLDERTKEYVPHGRLSEDEANAEFIAMTFGGGKYKAVKFERNESGKWVFAKHATLVVPGDYKPPQEYYGVKPEPTAATTTTSGPEPSSPSRAAPSAGESLNVALASQVLELVKTARAPAGPSMDWAPILTAAIGLLSTIVTKLMDRKETGPDPLLMAQLQEVKKELAALKDQPGPASSAMTDMLDSIERIVKVSSRVRKLAGAEEEPSDPESMMWGMGKKALEALMSGGQPQPSPVQVVGGPGASPAPVPPVPRPLWERVLIHHGRDILQAAARGVDPTLAAEWTANMLPSEIQGVVIELLRKPDAAELIKNVVPDLANYPQWLDEFVMAARDVMFGGGEEAETETETNDHPM